MLQTVLLQGEGAGEVIHQLLRVIGLPLQVARLSTVPEKVFGYTALLILAARSLPLKWEGPGNAGGALLVWAIAFISLFAH